jgi:hypothetical protein
MQTYCSENLKTRNKLEDLGVNGRIILKCVIKKLVVCGLEQWLGIGPVMGSCEHGNEPSGFIKGGEFLI